LWDAHRKHYGKEHEPVIIWQAETPVMNPTVPQSFIEAEYERDPANAAAEFGAQFRSDIESFISREAVEAVISPGVIERAPVSGLRYAAFCDVAGGSGKDSFTLAIAHMQDGVAVLDAIRERKPPFSPEDVVAEYSTLLVSYGIRKILGDRYAGDWPREQFKKRGITYDPAVKPKSDLYRDALPLINSRKVDLLDHPKLQTQLLGLERRTVRSGKDSIDHAPNAHDDVANAVCGVLTNIGTKRFKYLSDLSWVSGSDDDLNGTKDWRAGRLSQYIFGGYFR
jgi:hypothetical protein